MTEPRWLDETQQQAWQGFLVVFGRALPEIERTFKANGLLSVHYGILVALADAPGRTLRLTKLADMANTSPSRLSHRLRKLVDRGDVSIADDPTDGRVRHATLTRRGRRTLDAISPTHADNVRRVLFDHLSTDQTTALADALSTIASHLCDHDRFRTAVPGGRIEDVAHADPGAGARGTR